MKTSVKIMLVLIGGLCLVIVASLIFVKPVPVVVPQYTPEQIAAQQADRERVAKEKAAQAEKDKPFLNAVQAVIQARQNAIDPDSFKLKSAILMPSGAACFRFSLTNEFGGRIENWGVLTPKGRIYYIGLHDDSSRWHQFCDGPGGNDQTGNVRRVAGYVESQNPEQ